MSSTSFSLRLSDLKVITAATPGQCSGMTVDAVVFLPAHRRHMLEEKWWSGHMAQVSRRYVGNTRATDFLYILVEQPPPNEKPIDEYWLRVAREFNAVPQTLYSGQDLHFLDWPEEKAESIFSRGEALFDTVNWSTLADSLCPNSATRSIDVSALHFFTSRAHMEKRA